MSLPEAARQAGPMNLEQLAEFAKVLSEKDGRPVEQIMLGTQTELGELAEAIAAEDGHFGRKRALKEPSRMEAADLIVAGIALYGMRGGRPVDLAFDVEIKMRKWANTVQKALAERAGA